MAEDCLLCAADAFECDENTYRSLHWLIGKNAPEEMPICEEHVRRHAFGLVVLSMITGHGEFAEPIKKALEAPKLRLVPPLAGTEGDVK